MQGILSAQTDKLSLPLVIWEQNVILCLGTCTLDANYRNDLCQRRGSTEMREQALCMTVVGAK